MKISLPIKLTIFVVLLFAAVIAACLLWTPVRIRYYVDKFRSPLPKERVKGVDGLLGLGKKGHEVLVNELDCDREEVEFLAKHWAHANEPVKEDEWGCYPLHISAQLGYIDAIKLLFAKNVNVNAEDKIGSTPLHYAAANEHDRSKIAALLFSKGADINKKDKTGMTPLHWVALGGCRENAEFLIENGAELDSKENSDMTPLHWAACTGNKEIALLLIAKGADVKTVNEEFMRTALAPIKSKTQEIINIIRAFAEKKDKEQPAEENKEK